MPQLDGLRGIAVLAVMYTHFLPEPWWLFGVYWGGWGVSLFFVLSGFLITQRLMALREQVDAGRKSRGQALKVFFARRLLRLAPAYYCVLAIAAICGFKQVRDSYLWHIFYLSNFYFAQLGQWRGAIAHLWTLAVEEQFYLFWSLVVVLLPARRLGVGIGAIILTGPLFRLACLVFGWGDMARGILTPAALDILGLGSLLAWLTLGRVAPAGVSLLAMGGLGLLTGSVLKSTGGIVDKVVGPTAFALAFAAIVCWASRGARGIAGRLLESRGLVSLGRISYGVYLIHLFVSDHLERSRWPRAELPFALVATLATIALAAVSWRFVERPCNRLKRHFS